MLTNNSQQADLKILRSNFCAPLRTTIAHTKHQQLFNDSTIGHWYSTKKLHSNVNKILKTSTEKNWRRQLPQWAEDGWKIEAKIEFNFFIHRMGWREKVTTFNPVCINQFRCIVSDVARTFAKSFLERNSCGSYVVRVLTWRRPHNHLYIQGIRIGENVHIRCEDLTPLWTCTKCY